MPDDIEQVEPTEVAAPAEPGEPSGQTPAPQESETPAAPPQHIPYVRFKEVNDKAKASDERARAAEERLARFEAQARQAPAPQPVTTEQVFAAYEAGQITESQKDQWVMYLAKESAKQEFGQVVTQAATMMRSQGVVEQYAKAYPNVNDTSSPEFQEVKAAYLELLAEGAPATVATQAKALRMAFGPLKAQSSTAREHTRQRADTFLEGSGGGGDSQGRDPMKDVPERMQQHWKKMGYTKSQMVQEAKMREVRSIEDYQRLKVKAR